MGVMGVPESLSYANIASLPFAARPAFALESRATSRGKKFGGHTAGAGDASGLMRWQLSGSKAVQLSAASGFASEEYGLYLGLKEWLRGYG